MAACSPPCRLLPIKRRFQSTPGTQHTQFCEGFTTPAFIGPGSPDGRIAQVLVNFLRSLISGEVFNDGHSVEAEEELDLPQSSQSKVPVQCDERMRESFQALVRSAAATVKVRLVSGDSVRTG